MARKRKKLKAAALLPLAMVAVLAVGYFVVADADEFDFSLPSFEQQSQMPEAPNEPIALGFDSDHNIVALFDELVIADEQNADTYDRGEFGQWMSAEAHNWPAEYAACDTKWATRARDAENLVWYDQDNCIIETGLDDATYWVDPYGSYDDDGNLTHYTSDDPSSFDIDHVVSLGDAWRSGAWNMDRETRDAISNDYENLLVTDAGENRSKGDSGPADWTPKGDGYCLFIAQYIIVKHKYDLTVTAEDHAALEDGVVACS